MFSELNMIDTGKEINENTCCLCLSEEESSFRSDSVLKSLTLREMVNYAMGIQLHDIADTEQTISSSICNDCVLNVSNFYTFKKKIIQAQTLLGTISDLDEHTIENDDDDDDDDDDELQHTISIESEEGLSDTLHSDAKCSPDVIDIEELIIEDEPSKSQTTEPLPTITPTPMKRGRPTETVAKVSNKRAKPTKDDDSRVTIQTNECLICPAVLGDILKLDEHIHSHKHIICKVCNRSFARYSNLKRHFMATHSKPKPFQCDLCGLGFSFSVNLQAHAALHYSGKIRMK